MEVRQQRQNFVIRTQYLPCFAKVLRFFCVWDDRASLQGDRRPYRLHYFLEDDTVEVLEVRRASGVSFVTLLAPQAALVPGGRCPSSKVRHQWSDATVCFDRAVTCRSPGTHT